MECKIRPTLAPATVANLERIVPQLRLTFNYWRKGGYQIGSEDYRWEVVSAKVNNRFIWFLFNVVFISLTQSLLLLLITAPT